MSTASKHVLAILALFVGGQASAWAEPIYLCTDKTGRKELTDKDRPGCRPLDLPGLIPAPSRDSAAAPRPRQRTPVATPASFPRVDSSVQRARDNERRNILEEELRAEEQELAGLRAEFKNGEPDRLGNERNYAKYQERVANLRDAIARSEKNIEALRREISNIR